MQSSELKDKIISEFLNEIYQLPRIFVSHGKVVNTDSSDTDSYSSSTCSTENEVLRSLNADQKRNLSEVLRINSVSLVRKYMLYSRKN